MRFLWLSSGFPPWERPQDATPGKPLPGTPFLGNFLRDSWGPHPWERSQEPPWDRYRFISWEIPVVSGSRSYGCPIFSPAAPLVPHGASAPGPVSDALRAGSHRFNFRNAWTQSVGSPSLLLFVYGSTRTMTLVHRGLETIHT